MSESDLIHRAQTGDAGAWEALTRLHQEPVFRYAYLLLGDADDAQDVTQETFVRAFFGLKHFDLQRPLRPWLLSIAARRAHNWQRSAGRHLQALVRFSREPRLGSDSAPEPDQVEELRSAVRLLRPAFQHVILMRFFMELSEEETAQATGVPVGTIKSRLHRALRALRALLARHYPHIQESLSE